MVTLLQTVYGEALRVAALLALLEGERDAKVSALLCLPVAALLALLEGGAEQVAPPHGTTLFFVPHLTLLVVWCV